MAKRYCTIVGLFFLLIGILGYIPAVSPNGYLFGMLLVNPIHNMVHVVTGLIFAFVGLSGTEYAARRTALTFGIIYAVVTLLGFISGNVLGLFMVNMADNIFHLVVSIASVSVGMARERVLPLR